MLNKNNNNMPKSKPNKSIKKRKAPGTGVWKKVDVGIRDDGAGEDDNHYDSRNLQQQANKDLEATPGEGVGFFLGLEVIGGNDYRVEDRDGTKILVIRDADEAAEDSLSKRKPSVIDPTAKQESDKAEAEAQLERPKKKRKKKHKKKKTKPDAPENDDVADQKPSQKDVESESDGEMDPAEAKEATEKGNAEPMKVNDKKDPKKKSHKKKKKKAKGDDNDEEHALESKEGEASSTAKVKLDEAQVVQMQTAWMSQTGGVTLHEDICKSLIRQDFWTPTPIQAGCLPAAILGRRNIVGAAPTGSGKTIAFLLPIFQNIMEEEESRGDDPEMSDQRVKALILTPTRELAKQIAAECEKIMPRRAALVVGGLAHVKQQRLLSRRPPVVIGTPGRLWEMVRTHGFSAFDIQG